MDTDKPLTYERWLHEHYTVWGPKFVKAVLDNPESSKVMVWGVRKKEDSSD